MTYLAEGVSRCGFSKKKGHKEAPKTPVGPARKFSREMGLKYLKYIDLLTRKKIWKWRSDSCAEYLCLMCTDPHYKSEHHGYAWRRAIIFGVNNRIKAIRHLFF